MSSQEAQAVNGKDQGRQNGDAPPAADSCQAAACEAAGAPQAAGVPTPTSQEAMSALSDGDVRFVPYTNENDMPGIVELIEKDLSEPYSVFTYRYFINNWPDLCFLTMQAERCVGAIVCKLDVHRCRNTHRGYIAMLAVDKELRGRRIGSKLVQLCLDRMRALGADECVLETEVTNEGALALYRSMGFVKEKRLHKYYLNGNDAYRLKFLFKLPEGFYEGLGCLGPPAEPPRNSSAAGGGEGGEGGAEALEFMATLDMTGQTMLGVEVDWADGRTLYVKSVHGGAVQHWNQTRPPEFFVQPGARILAVNGYSDNPETMASLCRELIAAQMTVQLRVRGPPLPPAAPPQRESEAKEDRDRGSEDEEPKKEKKGKEDKERKKEKKKEKKER
eukprot:CAMPEP_0115395960 /NCGR_PEP_ID=MMETSP0271-20121206/13050_1 /TAXON_ID=71861 /ORGANISM="Scrippsiella trochoidea, Strain CCMP3099" /LENGTH=388 /DNA_ID=CAMNT_0002819677 /DNA_START=80 /DNA_END=1247 /DNA_ORIENTATION=-